MVETKWLHRQSLERGKYGCVYNCIFSPTPEIIHHSIREKMRKSNYYTIIDAISDLQARGFLLDFSLVGNKLLCAREKCYLGADDFDVLEMYLFHAGGLTRDETVIYAIESLSRPLKGILLNSGNQTSTQVPPMLTRKIRKFWV
jgi:hypothetical protein